MQFDATRQRCTIIIDKALPTGLAINAASIIGIGLGQAIEHISGHDIQSLDAVNYPGVIHCPLPVLLASQTVISSTLAKVRDEPDIYVMPFSALAQSCKTYQEYEQKLTATHSADIDVVALGIVGPKKLITGLTGNLALYR